MTTLRVARRTSAIAAGLFFPANVAARLSFAKPELTVKSPEANAHTNHNMKGKPKYE